MKILREVTPKNMLCGVGACPAIFETTNKSYLLIGKKVSAKKLGIFKRVAHDEIVVEVPKNLIDKKFSR